MAKIPSPNYTQIPNVILDHMDRLSDAELRVLLFICRQTFGWHQGKYKASAAAIAKATGMSDTGVQNGVKTMLEKGVIEREPDGKSFNYWVATEPAKPAAPSTNGVGRSEISPTNGVGSNPPTALVGGEPAIYKAKERKKGKGADAPLPPIPDKLNTPRFLEAWEAWLSERKAKRNKVSACAAKMQFKELLEWGPDEAVRSIEQSIKNGWTGLFKPEKEKEKKVGNGFASRETVDQNRPRY